MKKHPLEMWGNIVAGQKTRWLALAFWVLLVVIFSALWPQINSVENASTDNLPESSLSKEAAAKIDEQFPNTNGLPLLLVWHRESGLTNEDYTKIQSLYKELETEPVSYQTTVPSLSKIPPQALAQEASDNGSTIVTPVFFKEGATADQLEEAFEEITAQMDKDVKRTGDLTNDELNVRYSGPAAISVDATGLFENADFQLLLATVLLVLVLLILIYRSPLLAVIPLIAVGMAYGVISPALGFMAEQGWISKDAQAVSIMTVLLFGAGTDYCLFLITRYRETLLEIANKFEAMKVALKESGGAIAMSALTVVIGLASLGLADYAAFQRFAVPFSFGVLIMGITALLVLPAILVIIGRVAFWPFIPRTEEMERTRAAKKNKPFKRHTVEHKWSKKIGNFVVRKPWLVIVSTIVLLGGLALFAPKIQYTYDLLSSFPEDTESREGFTLIEENFSPGELAPVKLVIDTDGENIDLTKPLESLKYIDEVTSVQTSEKDKNYQLYELSLDANPYAVESLEHIPQLRTSVEKMLNEENIDDASNHLWVAGETATQYDEQQVIAGDEDVIVPVIIALIALLLVIYLRSITATFYLIATVLLSYVAALGAGWIVLHYFMGVDAIQGLIPLYSFVFLVALGEDYNIFMISEIWKKRKSKKLKEAVAEGVIHTGSVITSAGLILAGTFAVLATLPIQVLVQFGVVTAIGVLLDTFIVRPLLVPALTTVTGRFAFWPGKLFKKKEEEI